MIWELRVRESVISLKPRARLPGSPRISTLVFGRFVLDHSVHSLG
jgi:hypothetical protein